MNWRDWLTRLTGTGELTMVELMELAPPRKSATLSLSEGQRAARAQFLAAQDGPERFAARTRHLRNAQGAPLTSRWLQAQDEFKAQAKEIRGIKADE